MGRFEYKYPVPIDEVDELRETLSRYLVPDTHASREDGGYTVRSIYFDSFGLAAYHEKMAGACNRRKLRIRGYDTPNGKSAVFLEIKRKDDMIVSKSRSALPYGALKRLFPCGSPSSSIASDPLADSGARQFLYNVRRYSQRPVVLVRYERVAYFAPSGSPLRVTIDWNLCASARPKMGDLFSDESMHAIMPGLAVLEVKFPDTMPPWIESVIDGRGYEREAISKYTLGVEACGIVPNEIPTRGLRAFAGATQRLVP